MTIPNNPPTVMTDPNNPPTVMTDPNNPPTVMTTPNNPPTVKVIQTYRPLVGDSVRHKVTGEAGEVVDTLGEGQVRLMSRRGVFLECAENLERVR